MISKVGKQYDIHNSQNKWLGRTKSKKQADYQAMTGFASRDAMDEASELSWWQLWNDALNSGVHPLEDRDGTQFLSLGFNLFMSVKDGKGGWEIDILTKERFLDENGDKDWDDVLELKPAEKPYRLK